MPKKKKQSPESAALPRDEWVHIGQGCCAELNMRFILVKGVTLETAS